ncbi:MAG: AMP-binding protein [Antricoccus sp.]
MTTSNLDLERARGMSFGVQLSRLARTIGERPAFKTTSGTTLTYAELNTRSTKVANLLAAHGVGHGDRVAILMMNKIEYAEILWGIWMLGAVAVPLNFRLAPPEIEYLLGDSGAKALFVDAVLDTGIEVDSAPLKVVVGGSPTGDGLAYESEVETASEAPIDTVPQEHDIAAICYTSGTTGRPKGAILTHMNLLMQVMNMLSVGDSSEEPDVQLTTVPMFHIAGLAGLLPTFMFGGLSVIDDSGTFDPARTVEIFRKFAINSVFLVPTQWQAVCALAPFDPPISSLKRLSWGASPSSVAILTAMNEAFPEAGIYCAFGQSEMSPVTCLLGPKDAISKLGSIGKPLPTVETRIVDPAMHDVAPGEVGEIIYRGANMMQGYWNKPDATADAFHGGWFHSGDLVRADEDGFLYVVDRLKDMIISGGENIYCAEVEAALQSHPDVLEAAVIGKPDDRWIEVPIAIITRTPGSNLTEGDLLAHCQSQLARFKQPKEVHFVEALPRNASGKITKHTLRPLYAPKK